MARILIVEDDAPIREMYAFKLKLEGFDVFTAEDGEQGLNAAQELKPDLILLDLSMPVLSGQAALHKLREQEWGNDILVIVLTNISQNEAPMELRLLRVEKYIVKAHYTPKQVVDTVTDTLQRYKKITKQ